MNLLSGSDVLVEDQLFATLDPTVRQVELSKDHTILLSDTVGFIRKLPHHLVESFKSTLDEAMEADLLLHVVDVSHPHFSEQVAAVNMVLESVDAKEKPTLMVFNKIDKIKEKAQLHALRKLHPDSVFISATRQIRTETLEAALICFIEANFVKTEVLIPHHAANLVATVHEWAVVDNVVYEGEGARLRFRANEAVSERILQMVDKAQQPNIPTKPSQD